MTKTSEQLQQNLYKILNTYIKSQKNSKTKTVATKTLYKQLDSAIKSHVPQLPSHFDGRIGRMADANEDIVYDKIWPILLATRGGVIKYSSKYVTEKGITGLSRFLHFMTYLRKIG